MQHRYQLPGFQAPRAQKYEQVIRVREGGSLEWPLGPVTDTATPPVFTVSLYSVYGVLQLKLVLLSGESPYIVTLTSGNSAKYMLVLSYADLTNLLGSGDFEISYELSPSSDPSYLEQSDLFTGQCFIRIA